MKKSMLVYLVAVLMTGCLGGGKVDFSSVKLKDDKGKALYSLGYMMGGNLKRLDLKPEELKVVMRGIHETATGKKAEVEPSQYHAQIQELFKAGETKVASVNKERGKKLLADFVSKNKAKKTDSGLAYVITAPGKGTKPTADDKVEVHYEGTFIDDKGEKIVFDSSKQRGQTAKFPLGSVIKGWKEGLQLVAPGGKIKLAIPSDLAYGDRGINPKIPGGATLFFDVELIKILPKDAAKK